MTMLFAPRSVVTMMLLLMLMMMPQQAHGFRPVLYGATRRSLARHGSNNNQYHQDYTGINLGSSYVPSGLTAAEYESVKRAEAERKAALGNLGAWGPRFRRDNQAINGDWFVQPQLWTAGFGVNNNNANNNNNSNNNANNTWRQAVAVRLPAGGIVASWLLLLTLAHARRRLPIMGMSLVASAWASRPLAPRLDAFRRRHMWTWRRTVLLTSALLPGIAVSALRIVRRWL